MKILTTPLFKNFLKNHDNLRQKYISFGNKIINIFSKHFNEIDSLETIDFQKLEKSFESIFGSEYHSGETSKFKSDYSHKAAINNKYDYKWAEKFRKNKLKESGVEVSPPIIEKDKYTWEWYRSKFIEPVKKVNIETDSAEHSMWNTPLGNNTTYKDLIDPKRVEYLKELKELSKQNSLQEENDFIKDNLAKDGEIDFSILDLIKQRIDQIDNMNKEEHPENYLLHKKMREQLIDFMIKNKDHFQSNEEISAVVKNISNNTVKTMLKQFKKQYREEALMDKYFHNKDDENSLQEKKKVSK